MGLELIKKGQGTTARATAYALGAALIVYGAIRLYASIGVGAVLATNLPLIGDLTIRKVVATVVGGLALLGLHLVLNRERSVDLLVDTEAEMRKVTWPTWPEVLNATVVVVFVTVVLAISMSAFDWGLRRVLLLVF
jgi:preprotein translocase SecE subunit